MLTLDSIQRAIANDELPLTDDVADDIWSFVTSGEHERAGKRASQAVRDGCNDIRCFAPMMTAKFAADGPAILPELLSMISLFLGNAWERLAPAERRAVVVDGALTLTLRNIKTLFDHHEARRDVVWERWSVAIDGNLVVQARRAIEALEPALVRLGAAPRLGLALAALKVKCELSLERLQTSEQSFVDEVDSVPSSATRGRPSETSIETNHEAEDGASTSEMESTHLEQGLAISPEMAHFMERLEAFAILIERGEVKRAAIVAHDVGRTLDHFDPIRFLPGLISPYLALLSATIEQIAPVWAEEGSSSWQVLMQLYRADLKGFVAGCKA